MTPRRNVLGILGLVAAACFVIGPLLAWLKIAPSIAGFGLFALGGILAIVSGIGAIVAAVRGRGMRPGGVVALLVSVLFIVLATRGRGVPAINDFTTDPADPPAFHHAGTLGPNVGRDLAYPQAFAEIQRSCCADLHPARVKASPNDAFARARSVAEQMPRWTVTWTDPQAGLIEAVATSALFHFQDDIAIRVRPDGDGASRVDMRSKSRDGKGDLGVNAARIRSYVGTLEAGGK